MIALNLASQRFGRLVAQELVRHRTEAGIARRKWLCTCECGGEALVLSSSLLSGNSTSCGCGRLDAVTDHGCTGTPEFQCWRSMLNRCDNPHDARHAGYGGRGIIVCERWRTFANFLKDMGRRPGPDFSLDRINNDGNYEPGNCRWATRSQQQRNKRAWNKSSGLTGIYAGRRTGTWIVRIKRGRRNLHVGIFASVEAAAAARAAAIEGGI